MKVRASSNQLRLSYGANQQDGAEIVLDCYDSLEVIVHIEKSHEEYGDLFDSITIHSKHLPDLVLLPNIYIELTVHFVSPKIRFGFDGFSCTAYMPESPVTVCRIKPNKLGEYVMTVIALEGLSKI